MVQIEDSLWKDIRDTLREYAKARRECAGNHERVPPDLEARVCELSDRIERPKDPIGIDPPLSMFPLK